MIKFSKKILCILIALFCIFGIVSQVFATDASVPTDTEPGTETETNDQNTPATGTTTLEIVENNVCTIEIDDLAKDEFGATKQSLSVS